MTYEIIQPPFELSFRGRSEKDLVAYREWFHAVMPARTAELRKAVKGTRGFESWEPYLTPDPLGPLGEWFRGQVHTRKQTDEEMREMRTRLTLPIDVSDEELTTRTFSLAMDIGMYFGQVIVKTLPGTRWGQPVKNPNFADYGQPVIMGFGTVPLNPVRIAVTIGYAFAANERSGAELRATYDVWTKKRR